MPHLDESREALLGATDSVKTRANSAWEDFKDFALRDNVLEVAIGLIIAAAFTTVVKSFVSDILLPPISLLPFIDRNLDEKFAVLRSGPQNDTYNTMMQALDDGAVILGYGAFLSAVINFFAISLALFMTGRVYGWATSDAVIKHQVKCKYCRKRISEKAKRCVNCTSWQDGREG